MNLGRNPVMPPRYRPVDRDGAWPEDPASPCFYGGVYALGVRTGIESMRAAVEAALMAQRMSVTRRGRQMFGPDPQGAWVPWAAIEATTKEMERAVTRVMERKETSHAVV